MVAGAPVALLILLGVVPIVEAWRDPRPRVRLVGVVQSYALVSGVVAAPASTRGAALWFALALASLAASIRSRSLR